MLTIKKLNNLFMYFVLFRTSDDMNVSSIVPHYSYIQEKYDLFFTKPPVNDKFMDLHWGNQEVWNKGTDYMVKWNLDTNEFLNTEEYSRWLFTHYLVHSHEETQEIKKEYNYKISNEELRIRRLLKIYNKFFSSYDTISEESLEHLLHTNLKEFYYEVFEIHKMIFRNVFVNQLTK